MEPEGSLLCSQEPAIGPYPKPDEFSPHPTTTSKIHSNILLLSLAPQPSLVHGLLLKIRLNFLEASQQFSFLKGRAVSPTPKPHPGGPGLCIYIPQRQGGYSF
jgi:hypothetical protein